MSGGGTGGHIFPAIALAQEIQKRFPDAEFLFIGAQNKMEMQKVPEAGFKIEGLNIAGFNRGSLLKNVFLPYKVIMSLLKVKSIIKTFKPDLAIGTGGFASAPALYVASSLGVKTFIQEQNSLPGKTNQFLSKKALAVFTAYPKMEQFFSKTSTYFLGNPVRESVINNIIDSKTAKQKLGLDPNVLTILSVGGSLGSRTLNNGWKDNLKNIENSGYQLIWQTGKTEYESLKVNSTLQKLSKQIILKEFISDMALHYSAADVIVSRAGAIAISELAIAQKALLLIPFPFAAEDHQTVNAMTLVEKNAAKMVKDSDMRNDFWSTLSQICNRADLRAEMSNNLVEFARPNATEEIVNQILKITQN